MTISRIKPLMPTTTAHQHRVRLFQASLIPKLLYKHKEITSFGSIAITGRLGQRHARVLEAIMLSAEKKGFQEDGRIKLLVDPYQVRKLSKIGGELLEKMLTELMGAVIDVQINAVKFEIRKGHIIDHIQDAINSNGEKITKKNPLSISKNKVNERVMWRVELGKALTDLINHDYIVNYDPAIFDKMRFGISHAVLRHALSHKTIPKLGWYLNTLIYAVSGTISDSELKNRRRELRKDAVNLLECGLKILDEKVTRV